MSRIFRIHQDYAALNIIQYYDKEPVVEYIGNAELFPSQKDHIYLSTLKINQQKGK